MLNTWPIFKIIREILLEINERNGLKLRGTGNLPVKIIADIYAKQDMLDSSIENGITNLGNEKDWMVIHTPKIVLDLNGIIRKYQAQMVLTKTGKKLISESKILFKPIRNSFSDGCRGRTTQGEIVFRHNKNAVLLRFLKRFAKWLGIVDIRIKNEKSFFDRPGVKVLISC